MIRAFGADEDRARATFAAFYGFGVLFMFVVGSFFWNVNSLFDYRVKTVDETPSYASRGARQ